MNIIKSKKGFTLVELIIAIAVFSVIIAGSSVSVTGFLQKGVLDNDTRSLEFNLENAQSNAMNGVQDSSWGVFLDDSSNTYTLFAGDSYATRTTSFDKTFELADSVSFQNITLTGLGSEIVFEKISGAVSADGSFELTSQNQSNTFSINSYGILNTN